MDSLTKYWWFVLMLVLQTGVCLAKTDYIDFNSDGVKEKIVIERRIGEHGPIANVEILDQKGKNLFAYAKSDYGNIPSSPGDSQWIDGKLYVQIGRINNNFRNSSVEILVFFFDKKIGLFIEEKMVTIKIRNKNENNSRHIYEYAKNNPGNNMDLTKKVHRILFYIRQNKINEAEKFFAKEDSNFRNYVGYEEYRQILCSSYTLKRVDSKNSIVIEFQDINKTKINFCLDKKGKVNMLFDQER